MDRIVPPKGSGLLIISKRALLVVGRKPACGRLLPRSIRQPHWHHHLDVKRPTRLRAGIGSWPAAVEAAGMSRHAKRKSSKLKRPKTKLGLPDLDHSKSAVLDSLRSPESKRGYQHAIDEFIQWYCSEPRLSFNKVMVTRYRIFLENRQLAAPCAWRVSKNSAIFLFH